MEKRDNEYIKKLINLLANGINDGKIKIHFFDTFSINGNNVTLLLPKNLNQN